MSDPVSQKERLRLLTAARDTCVETVFAAFEDGKVRGLCDEGAWEYAMGVLRQMDAAALSVEVEKRLGSAGILP